MQMTQGTASTAQSRALALAMPEGPGACLGCRDCTGACRAIAEALMVPDLVLMERSRAA